MKYLKLIGFVVLLVILNVALCNLCIKYQKIKFAYWQVHFLVRCGYEKSNNPKKDSMYNFVLRDNGNFIVNQRNNSLAGKLISEGIEDNNIKLREARILYEEWLLNNNSSPINLSEILKENLGRDVEIYYKK